MGEGPSFPKGIFWNFVWLVLFFYFFGTALGSCGIGQGEFGILIGIIETFTLCFIPHHQGAFQSIVKYSRNICIVCPPGMPTRFRACPYDPPGLEVSRGIPGHCSVGEPVLGDCVTDEDCFLKRLGNVCCYNRCRGMTECHRFP